MDQGVIEKLKRMYKRQFLRRLLLSEKDEGNVDQFLKKIDLKDCLYMLLDAWNTLTSENFKKAWHKIWNTEDEVIYEQDQSEDVREIVNLFQEIPGFSECGQDDVEAWINNSADDPGYQVLNDEEIVAIVQNEECADIIKDDDSGSNDEEQEQAENGPTHAEAFLALETAMAWCERQSECNIIDVLQIKRMRDIAAKKRLSSMIQKRIEDYFL